VLIAIDGPVGAGKSTVARAVAARLGLECLDTGAMYRSVALAALRSDTDLGSGDDLAALARQASIEVGDKVLLDGTDVTADLRGAEVSRAVSQVAAHPAVRAEMVVRQRRWATTRGGGVVEGRDMGSVVFPDASLKVFLTASEQERVRRRRDDESPEDLARRDRLDSARVASPLIPAPDAVNLDTTGKTVAEVVDAIVALLA